MSFFALYHPVLLVFLKFAICCDNAEVQAQMKEVVPVPGWFNSVEGFLVRNRLGGYQGSTESSKYLKAATENREEDRRSRKARKKRKRIVKKVMTRFENNDGVPEVFEIKSLRKRKRNRKGKRTFIKAFDENNVESNLSESHEAINKSRNPVDITVHIKMND